MIYIFYSDVSPLWDDIFFDHSLKNLSKEKREKVNRMKQRKDKNLSLAGQLILKYALNNLGYDYDNMCFKKTKSGKPFFENENIKFSISHSGNIAALAVSDKEIGIDIEKIKDYSPSLAKRVFGENEFKKLMSVKNESEKRDLFFRMWTLKEAYVKMLGKSIFDFKNFEIIPSENFSCSNTVPGCRFREFAIDGYRMSVSFMCEDLEIHIKKVCLSDIKP